MSLCINPRCQKRDNPDDVLFCQACGSELLLQRRYRVMRQLGGGGFGITFEVNEVRTNTPKVLKVLINNQPKAVELFQQEARVLSELNHPGIPKVERDAYFVYFPRDSQDGIHCLVMEKIIGMDLQKYMENQGMRPIDQTSAIEWLKELVTILHQVHSQNFFHRDIKPPNIMLRADGHLALIDFGTARALTQTYWFAQAQGQVTGINSAGYTPIEQMNGQAVPQSDFFSLGRTFVYLLTGKEPSDPAVYDSYHNKLGWRNYAPHISPQLGNLIDQMMAHLPSQRPVNTQEILYRIAEIEQTLNPPQRIPTPTQPVNNAVIPPTQIVPPKAINTSSDPPPTVTMIGWSFCLKWVLANAVGIIVGFAVFIAVAIVVYDAQVLNAVGFGLGFGLGGALGGTALGILQCLVLRRQINHARCWVLATAVGSAVGSAMGGFIFGSMGPTETYELIVFSAMAGTSIGIMQWLVLRRQVYKAGWWVLANGVGFAMFGFVNSVVSFVVSMVFVIAITGLVLVWLLRERISKS
jgi:hypothetical protein